MSHTPSIRIPADESRLSEVRDFVTRTCADLGLQPRAAANIRLAVDEACTNVIKHAYAEHPGDLTVEMGERKGWLEIRILDQGDRFDGRVEEPDLGKYVEDRRKGGFGLYLMQRLMDEVRYTSSPQGNVWLLRKRLPRRKAEFGKSLRFRYGLRTAFALLAVTVLGCAPLWVREGRERRRGDEQALRALAFGLADTARPVLLERTELSPEQTRLFEAVAEVGRREPRLLGVNVVDSDGTVWAADRSTAAFTHFRAPEGFSAPDAQGVQQVEQEFESQRVLHLCVPVRVQDARGQTRQLGAVHLSMRWTETEAAVRVARLRLAVLALGLYALGTALVAGLLAALLRPVQRLVDGVRSLGSGEEALDVDGPGEIGAIAAAFNEINAKYRAARQTAAEGERLQKDLDVAQEIQRSILPQGTPEIPGFEIAKLYRPAGQIGGDYYDFLPVNDTMTGIVVADVAGKGVPGSLVMSMIRTALRMEARDNTNAGDVLSRMNAFITADLRKGMFVTMYYVILDSVNRVISYASAGHNPMLLYRARTDESFFLNPKGFPVGLSLGDAALFGKSLDVERLRLQPGDMLVLYTDGITEATNGTREQYGEARLVQVVKKWGKGTPEDFVRELEADLAAFTAGAEQSDDLTLVAIKEKQAAPELQGGVRAKLVDLIERQGISVDEACRRLKVSPSTYYRFRRSPEPAAELETQHLSVEKREQLLRLVASRPDLGPKELSEALREACWGGLDTTPSLIHEELRRLELQTPALRASHAERSRNAAQDAAGRRDAVGFDAERHDTRTTTPAAPARVHVPQVPAKRTGPEPAHQVCGRLDLRGWIAPLEGLAGAVLVGLEGSVDSGSCEALEDLLQEAARDAAHVVVDLSGLAYVSSRGWGLFASDPSGLRARGGEVVLCGMRREVHDVYRMLGFEGVVRAFKDAAAAAAALPQGRQQTTGGAILFPARNLEKSLAAPVGGADRPARAAFTVARLSTPPALRMPVAPRLAAPLAPPLLEGLEDLDAEWESLRVRRGSVGPAGEVTLLALEGVLDTVSAYRFQQILGEVTARGARRIVVDLSCTEFVSSAGWGSFTAPLAELRRDGGDLKLFGLNRDVAHIYQLLGLRAVIASFDLLTEALEDFGLGASDTQAPAQTQAPAKTPSPGPAPESGPAARPTQPVAAVEPALARTFGGLKARLEPFGTTGVAARLHLQGALRGRNCGELRAWLLEVADPLRLLLVDAREVAEAKPEAWRPLGRYAQSLRPACAVHVIAPVSAAPPARDTALVVHETLADALRAYSSSSLASLRTLRLPDTEYHKDIELRREGWAAYLELVHSPQWKESA